MTKESSPPNRSPADGGVRKRTVCPSRQILRCAQDDNDPPFAQIVILSEAKDLAERKLRCYPRPRNARIESLRISASRSPISINRCR